MGIKNKQLELDFGDEKKKLAKKKPTGTTKKKPIVAKKKPIVAKKKPIVAKKKPTGATKKKLTSTTYKKKPTGATKKNPTHITRWKRRPTGTVPKKTSTAMAKYKSNLPATTKSTAMRKIAKKVGWAAARRAAGTALAAATGPVGWAALAGFTAYELGKMAGKKPKPTPTPKKVRVIEKNKPTGGGSIGRTSMKDFKPKSKVETTKKKLETSRYDPRKANRAGQKFGQRKAGGVIKKMKGGGRIKYI